MYHSYNNLNDILTDNNQQSNKCNSDNKLKKLIEQNKKFKESIRKINFNKYSNFVKLKSIIRNNLKVIGYPYRMDEYIKIPSLISSIQHSICEIYRNYPYPHRNTFQYISHRYYYITLVKKLRKESLLLIHLFKSILDCNLTYCSLDVLNNISDLLLKDIAIRLG